MPPPPGPYSGTSALALVARVSAFSFGLVYGSVKLKILKVLFLFLCSNIIFSVSFSSVFIHMIIFWLSGNIWIICRHIISLLHDSSVCGAVNHVLFVIWFWRLQLCRSGLWVKVSNLKIVSAISWIFSHVELAPPSVK